MAGRALRIGSLAVLWMAWNAPVRGADLPAFQEAAAAADHLQENGPERLVCEAEVSAMLADSADARAFAAGKHG